MNNRSDFNKFSELRRIQAKEYERAKIGIINKIMQNTQPSSSIYTHRSTMERKTDTQVLGRKRK